MPYYFDVSISMDTDTNTKFYTMKIYLHYCLEQYQGVVVITAAQLYSTKPEFRFCSGSNPSRSVLEIR